jgi:hypothetical protein
MENSTLPFQSVLTDCPTYELSGGVVNDPGEKSTICIDHGFGRDYDYDCIFGVRRKGKVNPSMTAELPFIRAPSKA